MNISDPENSEDSSVESGDDPITSPATEPNEEQKRDIARWVAEGMGLSDIQKKINADFGVVMTYMDVRFLVDDLDLTLVDKEEDKPKETDDATEQALEPEQALDAEGGVSVELDSVTPPGAMASGSVIFSDGQKKQWTLDQFGRLALSGGDEGYKPSEEDVVEFQKQLDGALRGKGF